MLCDQCRKKKYCTKGCKKAKVERSTIIRDVILKETGIGKILELMNRVN